MKAIALIAMVMFSAVSIAQEAYHFAGHGVYTDHEGNETKYEVSMKKEKLFVGGYQISISKSWLEQAQQEQGQQQKQEQGQQVSKTIIFTTEETHSNRFDVKVNGEKVGWGWYVQSPEGMWYDIHTRCEGKQIHINGYFDVAKEVLYQMGDKVDSKDRIATFVEQLELSGS